MSVTGEQKTSGEHREEKMAEKMQAMDLDGGDPYVVLMETNGEYCESWYYFLRYKGNEDNLKFLKDQIDRVDWYIIDDMSTFDIDLEHKVSAATAKQMSKVEVNSYMFHRKYDGVLDKIDFNFSRRDSDETKICKVNDVLGMGLVEDFIEGEDIDPEDMLSEDEDSSSGESPAPPPKKMTSKKGMPKALLKSDLPNFAKRKRKNNRNKE